MRELVWNAMLTEQMNVCYWNCLASRYSTREKWLKIFLAATSSGTVAGWTVWAHYDVAWKVLSGVSALVAIALPILDYSTLVQNMTKLATKCAQLRLSYDQLWAQIDTLTPDAIQTRLNELSQKEIEMSEINVVIADKRSVLERCQDDVLRSRGLK